jgi:hypothetical protein
MDTELLSEAKRNRENRNIINDIDYDLSFEDFILKIYINCDSSKYGESFQSYIKKNFFPKIKTLSKQFERGDLHVNYEKYFEVKISYLNKNGKYSITHIRNWQRFDYFILCFVDENFNSSIYCIPKNVITQNEKLNLNSMNGTKSTNLKNIFVSTRVSIKPNHVKSILSKKSVLKGTTYNDLRNFIYTL